MTKERSTGTQLLLDVVADIGRKYRRAEALGCDPRDIEQAVAVALWDSVARGKLDLSRPDAWGYAWTVAQRVAWEYRAAERAPVSAHKARRSALKELGSCPLPSSDEGHELPAAQASPEEISDRDRRISTTRRVVERLTRGIPRRSLALCALHAGRGTARDPSDLGTNPVRTLALAEGVSTGVVEGVLSQVREVLEDSQELWELWEES